ncbi:glucose oxidase [Colletotrichum chrysophilum]|uniref:Glucose oxidase n=1 Tax=Colletotrichum chrysophilum TaxID=1836956 RepID=A0AAD9E556_9PEZI|nr:glucose oxidase [Colletotrichum chrysophilum]
MRSEALNMRLATIALLGPPFLAFSEQLTAAAETPPSFVEPTSDREQVPLGYTPVWDVATVLPQSSNVEYSYDYVIVGAGTAGLTVADRLSADGKITDDVIEAGGGRFFKDPSAQYNITSVPQPGLNNRTQFVWIGCCVGGSSALNGMMMARGTKPEYDGWARLGSPGSTWDWNGVLPYFKKASVLSPPDKDLAQAFNITWDPEAWGLGASDRRISAAFPTYQNPLMLHAYKAAKSVPGVKVPLDGAGGHNGLFWFPSSADPHTYRRSYARSSHYDDIKRPNFHVIVRHKVRKILFEGTTAVGVVCHSRDDPDLSVIVRAKKEVIISAGAIHTPQILQLSGIGPKAVLDSAKIPVIVDLPGVGQNFQDHAFLNVDYRWGKGEPPMIDVPSNGEPKTVVAPNLGMWIGLPTMTGDYERIAACYEAQTPGEFLPPNSHPTIVAGYAAFKATHARLLRDENVNMMWIPLDGAPGGQAVALHTLSQGTVNINPLDLDGEPLVDYRALSNPTDLDIMVEIIAVMRRYMSSAEFAPYEPQEVSPGAHVIGEHLRAWIRENYIPTNFHPIATASKKPRSMGGVVDEDLLVYGTQQLSIADGSIMPMLPGANTQQTVYMLAEKATDLIKARS